jgi:hypothetical protein
VRPVLLQGGPAHGATVEVDGDNALALTGHGVPDGCIARYRPADGRKRDNAVFRFDGLDEIVCKLELHG